MLNGRGFSYERNNVNIVLTEKEAAAVANSVELDLCGYLEPEAEALLSSALEKFAGAPARPSDHHLSWTRRLRCLECGDSVRYVPLHCP